METDDVVNYNVDVLFEVLHVWPHPVPLSPRHPNNPMDYGQYLLQHNVSKSTTPYIHAHMIWTYRALPFLKELHSLLQQGHFYGVNYDETAVNVMLWKARANHTLCRYGKIFLNIPKIESKYLFRSLFCIFSCLRKMARCRRM
jgi:hypothetical protein